jgi:hypothetical protein
MSFWTNLANLLKDDIEVAAIPPIIAGLSAYQQQVAAGVPSPLAKAALINTVVASAPVALIQAEAAAINQLVGSASAALNAELTKANAGIASGTLNTAPAKTS